MFCLSPCSPGGLLRGDAVVWGTQALRPFFLALIHPRATTHLQPSSEWTTVAAAPLLNSPLLGRGCTETLDEHLSLKHLTPPSLHPRKISTEQRYQSFTVFPPHRYLSPLGSRPPLDYKETHREHARWELRGSGLCVSHPQSLHVITWHLS